MQDDLVHGIPKAYYIEASVGGKTYGYDLEDLATKFELRHRKRIEPVHLNPVTMKEFYPRTMKRIADRLDSLVDKGLIPSELRSGWSS